MKEWMQNVFFALVIIIICGFLPGCAAQLIGNAIGQGQNLTPEQIKAYNDIGSSVIGCFQIGGPPPVGNTQWIVIPKNFPMPIKFGDNCHLLQ